MNPLRQMIALACLSTGLGLIFSNNTAEAGLGIVIDQPVLVPTGDPQLFYQFDLYLQPGSALHTPSVSTLPVTMADYQADGYDSLTISGLYPESSSPTFHKAGSPFARNPFDILPDSPPGSSSFTFYYDYPTDTINNSNSPIYLGYITIFSGLSTSDSNASAAVGQITSAGLSYSSLTNPSGNLSSQESNGGVTLDVTLATPEPGTIALILSGIPLGIFQYYRRRTRHST